MAHLIYNNIDNSYLYNARQSNWTAQMKNFFESTLQVAKNPDSYPAHNIPSSTIGWALTHWSLCHKFNFTSWRYLELEDALNGEVFTVKYKHTKNMIKLNAKAADLLIEFYR